MANSDRKIIRGVLLKDVMYVPGKEDELDALLSADEVKRLSDKGYIEGKWSGGTAAKVEAPQSPATKKEEAGLDDLKKDELLDRAEALGVKADASMTKAEIIAAIEGK